jgi:hypothetical protein
VPKQELRQENGVPKLELGNEKREKGGVQAGAWTESFIPKLELGNERKNGVPKLELENEKNRRDSPPLAQLRMTSFNRKPKTQNRKPAFLCLIDFPTS